MKANINSREAATYGMAVPPQSVVQLNPTQFKPKEPTKTKKYMQKPMS